MQPNWHKVLSKKAKLTKNIAFKKYHYRICCRYNCGERFRNQLKSQVTSAAEVCSIKVKVKKLVSG